jgi:hypothetical protein
MPEAAQGPSETIELIRVAFGVLKHRTPFVQNFAKI